MEDEDSASLRLFFRAEHSSFLPRLASGVSAFRRFQRAGQGGDAFSLTSAGIGSTTWPSFPVSAITLIEGTSVGRCLESIRTLTTAAVEQFRQPRIPVDTKRSSGTPRLKRRSHIARTSIFYIFIPRTRWPLPSLSSPHPPARTA